MRKNIKAEYQSHDRFQHLNNQMQITKLPMEEGEKKKGLILNSAKKKLSDEKHNHSEMFIQSPTQHHRSSRRRNECFLLKENARFRTQRQVITIVLTKNMQFVLELQTQEAEETETDAEEELHCICIARWPARYERECQIKENSEATKRTQNNKKGSMQEDFVL